MSSGYGSSYDAKLERQEERAEYMTNQESSVELEACQCGGIPKYVNDNGGVYLACHCGMRTRTSGDLETVVRIWNTRAQAPDPSQQSDLSALRERVRELESVLESVCWVEDEEEDVGMSYTQCRFCSGFSKHNSGCILSTGSAEPECNRERNPDKYPADIDDAKGF